MYNLDIFLKNRVSTKVLQNKPPMETLLKIKQDNYFEGSWMCLFPMI